MKFLKRLLVGLLVLLTFLFSVSWLLFENNKQWIQNELTSFLNENFQGTFSIEKLGYSPSTDFSKLKITLGKVLITSSQSKQDTVIYSNSTFVALNIKALVKESKVLIEKVSIDEATVNLSKKNKSLSIAQVFRKRDHTDEVKQVSKTNTVQLSVKNISIKKCDLNIGIDDFQESLVLKEIHTNLSLQDKLLAIDFQSKQILSFSIPSLKFVKDFGTSTLKFSFAIDSAKKEITVDNGKMTFEGVGYDFNANYKFQNNLELILKFKEAYEHTKVIQETNGIFHYKKTADNNELDFLLRATKISLDDVLPKYTKQNVASGNVNLDLSFRYKGDNFSEILDESSFDLEISGQNLILKGADLDEILKNYKKSQNFNLVDVTAFAFAGPMGTVAVKSADFTKLLTTKFSAKDSTQIEDLILDLSLKNGILKTEDVAFSTLKNRLALFGEYSVANDSIPAAKVAVLSDEGCEVLSQGFHGKTSDIKLTNVKVFKKLVGAVINLIGTITFKECEPIYFGKIKHPVSK